MIYLKTRKIICLKNDQFRVYLYLNDTLKVGPHCVHMWALGRPVGCLLETGFFIRREC